MTPTLLTEELSALAAFLVQTKRWQSLHLKWVNSAGEPRWPWLHSLFSAVLNTEGSPSWETLQQLEIEAGGICLQDDVQLPFSSIAPNLRELKISLYQIENATSLIQGSFIPKKLRRLEINAWICWDAASLPRFWYRTLPQATNLEYLKILDHRKDREPGPILQPQNLTGIVSSFPVSNLALTTLAVHNNVAARGCLEHLSLPALTSLTLISPPMMEFNDPDPILVVVERLITQSNCNIKHVRLEDTPGYLSDLVMFLRLLTTLETLELYPLSKMGHWHLPSILEALSRETRVNSDWHPAGPILPNLTSFYVGCQWINRAIRISKEAFTEFVEDPRRWPTSQENGAPTTNPRGGNSIESSFQCARLENAQLFCHGPRPTSLECYYARGRRAANYV
jgi:hypothetical protein